MAYKTLLFVVLNIILVHADYPEEPCECGKDASVWKFLKTLFDNVPDSQKDDYAVFPGMLSPLADCECESERRKRKILESDDAPAKVDSALEVDSPAEVDSALDGFGDQKVRARKSLNRGSCPDGKVRFGRICINEDTFDY